MSDVTNVGPTWGEIHNGLVKPFPVKQLMWRKGRGNTNFVYIDARDVMDRLDKVCGAGNWQTNYSESGGIIVCNIGIRLPYTTDWVWKADGAGETDVEGEKGAMSSALKRAAVQWGVGRYLYYMKLYPQLSANKQVPDWMHPDHERWM